MAKKDNTALYVVGGGVALWWLYSNGYLDQLFAPADSTLPAPDESGPDLTATGGSGVIGSLSTLPYWDAATGQYIDPNTGAAVPFPQGYQAAPPPTTTLPTSISSPSVGASLDNSALANAPQRLTGAQWAAMSPAQQNVYWAQVQAWEARYGDIRQLWGYTTQAYDAPIPPVPPSVPITPIASTPRPARTAPAQTTTPAPVAVATPAAIAAPAPVAVAAPAVSSSPVIGINPRSGIVYTPANPPPSYRSVSQPLNNVSTGPGINTARAAKYA